MDAWTSFCLCNAYGFVLHNEPKLWWIECDFHFEFPDSLLAWLASRHKDNLRCKKKNNPAIYQLSLVGLQYFPQNNWVETVPLYMIMEMRYLTYIYLGLLFLTETIAENIPPYDIWIFSSSWAGAESIYSVYSSHNFFSFSQFALSSWKKPLCNSVTRIVQWWLQHIWTFKKI